MTRHHVACTTYTDPALVNIEPKFSMPSLLAGALLCECRDKHQCSIKAAGLRHGRTV